VTLEAFRNKDISGGTSGSVAKSETQKHYL